MKNYKTNVKCKYCNSTFSSDIFDEENVCPACKEGYLDNCISFDEYDYEEDKYLIDSIVHDTGRTEAVIYD